MRYRQERVVVKTPGMIVAQVLVLAVTLQAAHADWADWWRTPEQQARAALESGDIERLQRIAPDSTWQGIAQHESGDFESSAKTFGDAAQQERIDGNTSAANRALYNQGVSEVRAGQYEKAVETFDQVLQQNPQFDDALHNRNIAQQLIQQQEQQQQPGEGEGESDSSSQDGEQQSTDETGEPSSDSQADDQGDEAEPSDSEQSQSGEQSGDSDDDAEEPDSQTQAAADEQAARDALEAEAQAQAENQNDEQTDEDAQQNRAEVQEQPMSESDQATEQWLRRIPDDPAGLLRRKLEQSHRTDYPQVRDSGEPW